MVKQRALTCLVLEGVDVFATLSNLGNVIPHDTDSVIDLTLYRGRLGVAARLGSSARRGTAAGQVRVIGFRPVQMSRFRAICTSVIGSWLEG
jgi:hypothetical protein